MTLPVDPRGKRSTPPLPLLKPADWELRDQMVCRPLATLGGAPGIPLVAYGWDDPNTFELLSRETAGSRTPESYDALAVMGLRARSASWQRIDVKLGWFKKLRMLVCGDDFLAAERILDEDFLRAAADTLGAKLLAAGIPRRGMLMVCDGASSKDNLARFAVAVAGQHHRAETPPITSIVFGVADGKIVGRLDDGGEADRVIENAPIEDHDEIYLQTITVRADDDTQRAMICAGGASLPLLESRIRREVAGLTSKYGITLRAEVQIIPDLTPKTAALDPWLRSLAGGLTGLVGELGTPHDVRVVYGTPD